MKAPDKIRVGGVTYVKVGAKPKVLGQTRSGKPIYENRHFPESAIAHRTKSDNLIDQAQAQYDRAAVEQHPDFTAEDHKDAASLYAKLGYPFRWRTDLQAGGKRNRNKWSAKSREKSLNYLACQNAHEAAARKLKNGV